MRYCWTLNATFIRSPYLLTAPRVGRALPAKMVVHERQQSLHFQSTTRRGVLLSHQTFDTTRDIIAHTSPVSRANQPLDGDGLAYLFSNQHDYLIFDTLSSLGTQDRQHSLHSLRATRVVLFDRLHWVGSSFFYDFFWRLWTSTLGTNISVPDASLSVIRRVKGGACDCEGPVEK